MPHATGQPTPLPPFERPSQAVVFLYLEVRCQAAGGRCWLSLPELAAGCRLSMRTIQRVVIRLDNLGWISYQPGKNQYWPTQFAVFAAELPPAVEGAVDNAAPPRGARWATRTSGRGERVSVQPTAVAKFALDTPSDKDDGFPNNNYLSLDDGVVHNPAADNPSPNAALPLRLATGLNDLKNLALYHSYCRRFSLQIILKAYLRALAPPDEKIRVSRGALFNHLCQHYAQREKQQPNN